MEGLIIKKQSGGTVEVTELFYIDCRGRYVTSCTCQNPQNCIPQRVNFTVRKFFLKSQPEYGKTEYRLGQNLTILQMNHIIT